MSLSYNAEVTTYEAARQWAHKISLDVGDKTFQRVVGTGKSDEDKILLPKKALELPEVWRMVFRFDADAKLVEFMGYLSNKTVLKPSLVSPYVCVWKSKLFESPSDQLPQAPSKSSSSSDRKDTPSLKGLFLQQPTQDLNLKEIERALRNRAALLKKQSCSDDFMWLRTPADVQANAASYSIAKMAALETWRLLPKKYNKNTDPQWADEMWRWKAAEAKLLNARLDILKKDEQQYSRLLTDIVRPRVLTLKGNLLDFTVTPPTKTRVDFREPGSPWEDFDKQLLECLDPQHVQPCTRWVEMPFEQVPHLVRRRGVIIRWGIAYVPMYLALEPVSSLSSLFLTFFLSRRGKVPSELKGVRSSS